MHNRRKHQRGSTLLEFTLIGIPLLFTIISTFEIARGMWIYQTLAFAVKDGAKYASVHGNSCSTSGNSCSITVADMAARIKTSGSGLLPDELSFTLTDSGGSINCATLSACLTNATAWPTAAGGVAGSSISITARYAFVSSLAMFWPGHEPVRFATVNLPASARATIQF